MTNKVFTIQKVGNLSLRFLLHLLMLKRNSLDLVYPRDKAISYKNQLIIFDQKNQHLGALCSFEASTILIIDAPKLIKAFSNYKELEIEDLPVSILNQEKAYNVWLSRFGFKPNILSNFQDPEDLLIESKKLFFMDNKEDFICTKQKEDPLQTFIKSFLKRDRINTILSLLENKAHFTDNIFPVLIYLSKAFKNKASSEREVPGWDAGTIQDLARTFSRLDYIYRKINIDYFEHFLSIILLVLDPEHISLDSHLYLTEPFELL